MCGEEGLFGGEHNSSKSAQSDAIVPKYITYKWQGCSEKQTNPNHDDRFEDNSVNN